MRTFSQIILFTLFTAVGFSQTSTNQNCPCCSPEYRQFDFWVGQWEVFSNNKVAGYNTIDIIQDSCILQENWTSAAGPFTGTSYNYYDKVSGKWNQLWIDNSGNPLKLSGNLNNGQMILLSDPSVDNKGNIQINRIIWTPQDNGNVRQLWEVSNDGGQTWSSSFDGMYKRKEK